MHAIHTELLFVPVGQRQASPNQPTCGPRVSDHFQQAGERGGWAHQRRRQLQIRLHSQWWDLVGAKETMVGVILFWYG